MMNWEYVAGFFDGEGSFTCGSASSRGMCFPVRFTQVNGEVMKHISEFLTAQGIKHGMHQYTKVGSLGKQPQWIIHFASRAAVLLFTKNIAHRLHVKKTMAQDIYRFLVMYPAMPPVKFMRRNNAD